jgi:hypothetical protein
MTKISNSSIRKESKPKFSGKPIIEYIYDFNRSFTLEQKISYAIDMLKEATENKNIRKFNPLLRKRKITRNQWDYWLEDNPVLKEYNELILGEIGDRREDGMLTKKFAEKTGLLTMCVYDPEWKKIYKFHAELNNLEKPEKQKIIVEIRNVSDNPNVKPLKSKEDGVNDKEPVQEKNVECGGFTGPNIGDSKSTSIDSKS